MRPDKLEKALSAMRKAAAQATFSFDVSEISFLENGSVHLKDKTGKTVAIMDFETYISLLNTSK